MTKTKNPGGRPRTSFVCEPAVTVIDRLGGIERVAAHLGLAVETVTKWGRLKSKGGGGGQIPVKYWPRLIAWSYRRKSVETLTHADLMVKQ